MSKKRTIYYSDKKEIVELFVGKAVHKVDADTLLLSDGMVLEIIPNTGGCSCGGGDYDIAVLNGVENIITNVEIVENEVASDWKTSYDIFVLAGDQRINLLSVQGDDGSGYYGTGYWITVRHAN